MRRPSLLAVLVVLGLLLPAVAAAQSASPFDPVPQPQEPTTSTPTATSTTTGTDGGGGGLSGGQEALIGLAALVLIGGIGYAIVRDARSHAPVTDADLRDPLEERRGTRAPRDRKKAVAQRRRAKASRKRNARR